MRTRFSKVIYHPFDSKYTKLFWSHVDKSGECWKWTGSILESGYGQFRPGSSCLKTKRWRAHRYSWVLFHGPIPDGLKVLHKCDNRKCVNPDHLFLGTDLDNVRDCISKGRGKHALNGKYKRNVNNISSKITQIQADEIRYIYLNCPNISQQCIANQFGINQRSVSNIIRNKTWSKILS
jgi:HNH endonuclease